MPIEWREVSRLGASSDDARTVVTRPWRRWAHRLRSDAALLRIAQAGDPLAFHELVVRFRDRIYTLAVDSLRDPDAAGDVVCEVFVTAYRRLGGFDRSCSPATWFYIIALGAVFSRLRSEFGDYTLEWRRPAAAG